MSYFIFNGTDSRELGLIVTSPMLRPTWARAVEERVIPGRERPFRRLLDYYNTADLSVKTVISGTTPERVHEIYSTLRGMGTLILSGSPNEYMNVTVQPLVPEPVALLTAELPISFTCEPFAKSITETVYDLADLDQQPIHSDDPVEIENPGSIYCYPEISFLPYPPSTGGYSWSFYLNGTNVGFIVKIPDDTKYYGIKGAINTGAENTRFVIDCEDQVMYFEAPNASGILEKTVYTDLTKGDFPELVPGTNTIRTNSAGHSGKRADPVMRSCSVRFRARWL